MAGMQRFITYIYSYEDGSKGGNTGFAKIEIRGNECRLEIHLRGIRHFFGEMPVYLFVEKTGAILCIPVGTMKIANGNGDFGIVLNTERIGNTNYRFNDIEGLLVTGDDEGMFLSRWLEGNPLVILKKNIQPWTAEPEPVQAASHQTEPQAVKTSLTESEETGDRDTSDMQATEVPMRNFFPQYQWPEVWSHLKETCPMFLLYNNKEEIPCVRIELKDLRELPKKYWYLGNNSFLLHGFFNYRYLILGEIEEDRWFLGIPGVYQQQERVMAAIFGFSDFLAQIVEPGAENEQKETEPMNQFGYWYHMLDE